MVLPPKTTLLIWYLFYLAQCLRCDNVKCEEGGNTKYVLFWCGEGVGEGEAGKYVVFILPLDYSGRGWGLLEIHPF